VEIIIRVIYILLFAILQAAYSYDTIEVLNKGITVSGSGYYVADKNISANEAYALYTSKAFKELPKEAKSFGFDDKSYWYAFTVHIDNNLSERYYLDVRSPTVHGCELYAFKNGNLLKREISGLLIPQSKRALKESPSRFVLQGDGDTVIYLLKINTNSPRFSAFAFGLQGEVYEAWQLQSFIFAFTTGIFVFVSFFSIILYAKLRDRIYLFYLLYICGLYGSVAVTSGNAYPLSNLFPGAGAFLIIIILQAQFIGLTLFTEQLLSTRSKMPRIARYIRILLYVNIVFTLAFHIHPLFRVISFSMSTLLFVVLLFAALKVLKYEFKLALYYMLATGAALGLTIAFTLVHQGIISYGLFSSNFLTLALIWDMTFLSLAIAYRIKLLQRENMEKERILTLKSRQETLGELTGNVAHQWRSPLAEIGAIVSAMSAQLIYAQLPKQENLDYLARISKIIQHLSNTVETFQCFLVSKDKKELFDFSKSIEEIVNLVKPSLQTENIELLYAAQPECLILGEQNEISQAVLVLIQNAKEALIDSNTQNGYICITLAKTQSCAVLSVKDNAGGVKLTPIEKVFDPYLSTKQKGTGMGLFLAKTIIEKRHTGKLSVKNEDDGAVFTIELTSVL